MPACFQLIPKGSSEPLLLWAVDAQLCWHFKAPVDDRRWYEDWYNVIGFKLACGKSFEQVRRELPDWAPDDPAYVKTLTEICDYLSTNFQSDSWTEIGRRA